jgi:hypothetical protein
MCTTQFEQCTYMGYVLLEAPRKYVLHGPLLSIYLSRSLLRLLFGDIGFVYPVMSMVVIVPYSHRGGRI